MTPPVSQKHPPFSINKWALEAESLLARLWTQLFKGAIQPQQPDHQDHHCLSPAKLQSVLYSLPAGTLYSNQTVLHWREKSMPWAENPDLPMCSSEMGQSLWTHVSPPASGIVTAEGVSRLNYTKYASFPKQQLQRKKLVSNGYY